MRAAEIIRQKRDGETLSPEAIANVVAAATAFAQGKPTEWEKYQLSALLMAIWLKGMSPEETAILTRCMTDSGQRELAQPLVVAIPITVTIVNSTSETSPVARVANQRGFTRMLLHARAGARLRP